MGPDAGPSFDAPPPSAPPVSTEAATNPPSVLVSPEASILPADPTAEIDPTVPESTNPAGEVVSEPDPVVGEPVAEEDRPVELSRQAIGRQLGLATGAIEKGFQDGKFNTPSGQAMYADAVAIEPGSENSLNSSNALLAITDGLRATGLPENVRRAELLESQMKVQTPDGKVISFKDWDRTKAGPGELVGFNFGETKDPAIVRVDTVLDNQIKDLEQAILDLQELGENAKGLAEKRKLYAKAVAARNARGELGPMFKLAVLRDMKEQGLNVSSAIDEFAPNESEYQKDFNRFLTESGMDPKEAKRLGKLVKEKGLAEALANNKIHTPKGLEEKVFGRALSVQEAKELAKAFMTEDQMKKYGAKDGLILLLLMGVLSAVEIAKVANPLNEPK